MKKIRLYPISLGFISGMFFGVSILALTGFNSSPLMSPPAGFVNPISVQNANLAFKKYLMTAVPFTVKDTLFGITVEKPQLDAMNNLVKENPSFETFRIYRGIDNNSKKIAIVVGVDLAGKDAIKNTLYATESKATDPCPPLCDQSSPITAH